MAEENKELELLREYRKLSIQERILQSAIQSCVKESDFEKALTLRDQLRSTSENISVLDMKIYAVENGAQVEE